MAVASLDQARVIAFALEHGTSAAARKFRVSDSYVRRLKRQAGESSSPARPALRVVAAPSVAVSRVTHLQLLPAHMVARAGTLWRCPACHELVRVAPGTLWNSWIEQKKCLHASKLPPAPSSDMLMQASPSAPADVPVLPVTSEALARDKPAVPVPQQSSAGVTQLPSPAPAMRAAPASRPQLVAVMSFLLPWLLEYWRFALGVLLGLALLVYLSW
jgi:hypothetical protein